MTVPMSSLGYDGPDLHRRRPSESFEVTSRRRPPGPASIHSREESSSSQSSISSPPTSVHSLKGTSPITSPATKTEAMLPSPPLESRVHILVTQDSENLTAVDVDLNASAAAIREIVLARLRIADDQHAQTRFHRGRFGSGAEGPPLAPEAFKAACAAAANAQMPQLFVVVIDRPSPSRTPAVPLRDVFPAENRVASEQEAAAELRSNRAGWHRPRASDPSPTSTHPPKPEMRRLAASSSSTSHAAESSRSQTSHLLDARRSSTSSDEEAGHTERHQQPSKAFPRAQHLRTPSLEQDWPQPEYFNSSNQALRRPSAPTLSPVMARRNSLEQLASPQTPLQSWNAPPNQRLANPATDRRMADRPRLQGLSPAGPYLQPINLMPGRRPAGPPSHASQPHHVYGRMPPNPQNPRQPFAARSTDDLRKLQRYQMEAPPPMPQPQAGLVRSNVRPPPQRLPFPGQAPPNASFDPRMPPPQRPPSTRPPTRQAQAGGAPMMPSYSTGSAMQQNARPIQQNQRPPAPPAQIRTDVSHANRAHSPYDYPLARYDLPKRAGPPPSRPTADYTHPLALEPGGVLQQALTGSQAASSSNRPRPSPQNQFMRNPDPSKQYFELHVRDDSDTRSPVISPGLGRGSQVNTAPAERRVVSPERDRPTHRSGSSSESSSESVGLLRQKAGNKSGSSSRRAATESDAYGGSVLSDEEAPRTMSPPNMLLSPLGEGESRPPMYLPLPEPSAPDLWEDDFNAVETSTMDQDALHLAAAMLQFSDDETGTVKADEWAEMIKRFGQGDEDTLRAGRSNPAAADLATVKPLPPSPFMFQDDDEDSDDEGATWAKPMESALKIPIDPSSEPGASPRPSLKVQIDQLPIPARPQAPPVQASTSKSGSATPSPGLFTAKDSDDLWAVRPSVDRVYDNLEKYFPNHDLDKPIVEAGVISPTTPSAIPNSLAAAIDPPPAQKFKHKKSIRLIAQDRKRFLQKAETVNKVVTESVTSLLRRKSTRLWGTRTEEVKVGKGANSQISTINESPSSTSPENFSFKWMKGEMIGKGSYGKVYLAFNVTTGDMLAVKQVEMPQTSSDKDNDAHSSNVTALKFEIQTLKDMDHVNIVQYLGFEETTEFLSIFLEYVPGGSVGRCIRKHFAATRTGFEEPLVKHFTIQIISALSYLHKRGILHRDLKADNVLVDNEGNCKISDFGISKRSDDIYNDNVEMSMQGSIFWMAPEVIHNGKRGYSAKVDIWSLGCVVVEMLSGRRPWNTEQMFAALYKLGAEKMAPPIPDDVQVSGDATEFLTRCFTIDPVCRPTADQLSSDAFMQMPSNWRFSQSSLAKMLDREKKPSI